MARCHAASATGPSLDPPFPAHPQLDAGVGIIGKDADCGTVAEQRAFGAAQVGVEAQGGEIRRGFAQDHDPHVAISGADDKRVHRVAAIYCGGCQPVHGIGKNAVEPQLHSSFLMQT